MAFDPQAATAATDQIWEDSILPTLVDYIRVPAVSSAFDPDWAEHGYLDAVTDMARHWCEGRAVAGLSVEIVRLPGRTPVVWFEVLAFGGGDPDDTVLLYGHLDKQPPMHGWREGLGPWEPVLDGDRLYGRGGADDGYAVFASLAAIEAVQAAGGSHGRCVGFIETSEESGSPDLPAYVEHLAARIGTPSLVVCLDSFCSDYDRLWTTTSLRGLLYGVLRVDVLDEGIHAGSAGGVVPSSFRILRGLLDRIEDAATGRILLPELHAEIPPGRVDEIAALVADLGADLTPQYPYVPGAGPTIPDDDPAAQVTARTWEPTLATIAVDGIPALGSAGNVLRPYTALGLSFRLPPTVDAAAAGRALTAALTADPPYGTRVTFDIPSAENG
ncbi:MAG TPA: M20/M25/M40 family metallo-hydrolase, partial [Acidimicrobiales bacterium]